MRPRHKGQTVLIVDHDAAVRRFCHSTLQYAGYRVLQATGGAEAVQAARGEEAIHALITDIATPGMSGPEIYDQLLLLRPGIKVVYMVGSGGSIMQKAMEAVCDFIEKPVDPEALIAAVGKVVG